jgi:hypothetical protein
VPSIYHTYRHSQKKTKYEQLNGLKIRKLLTKKDTKTMLIATIVVGWYAALGAIAITMSQYSKEPKQLIKQTE